MMFFLVARLTLPPETLRLIGCKMHELGAQINPDDLLPLEKTGDQVTR